MTQHSYTGLRAYHARNPRPSQLVLSAKLAERRGGKAFAMLSVDAVLANLTDEQRAELATKIHPKSVNASAAAIRSAAFKEAAERQAKVMASEHYAGNEKLAANLLSHPKLTSTEIVSFLAVAPKAEAVDPQLEEDHRVAAARADMRARLAANAARGSGDGADNSLVDAMRARWNDIHAEVAEERGYGNR